MLELLMKQIIASMKDQGLDPADIKAKIETVVNDVHAMKQSQDRTEVMVRDIWLRGTPLDTIEAMAASGDQRASKYLEDKRDAN